MTDHLDWGYLFFFDNEIFKIMKYFKGTKKH